MLGFYEGFPRNFHKNAYFRVAVSKKRLEQAITKMLHELNSEVFSLDHVAGPSVPQCTAAFELGLAEANKFNYLDKKETDRALKIIKKEPLQVMDFYCAVRYYKTRNSNRTPLKFDYYMLRFTFDIKTMEIQVFHERGPRHVSPEEVISFIANKINEMRSRKILKAFTIS